MSNDASPVVVSEDVYYYDMDTAPMGKRCLALTRGGIAVQEVFNQKNKDFYEGWFPLPKKRRYVDDGARADCVAQAAADDNRPHGQGSTGN